MIKIQRPDQSCRPNARTLTVHHVMVSGKLLVSYQLISVHMVFNVLTKYVPALRMRSDTFVYYPVEGRTIGCE